MKKLDLLILRSFAGPFLLTFAIASFVLMMHFLWKYFEDFVGKGLDTYIIVELLFFALASFVMYAVPMAVLLSSLMTYGRLGEFYEIVAMKSVGIGVTRAIRPLLIVAFGLTVGLFFFANNIIPAANLNFYSLLYDITETKPLLQLKDGIFYNGLEGYSIRVKKIDNTRDAIEDILIYDHTESILPPRVILSRRGTMKISDDKRFLKMTLFDGSMHEAYPSPEGRGKSSEYGRTYFREYRTRFDLSGFQLTRTDKQLFASSEKMMNIIQLDSLADTLRGNILRRTKEIEVFMRTYLYVDSSEVPDETQLSRGIRNIFEFVSPEQKKAVFIHAQNNARMIKGYSEFIFRDITETELRIRRCGIEYHRKFTLPFACLVFLLVGAPLGTMIRKGGLGLPLVVAILVFVVYWLAMSNGEKLAKEGILSPWFGMWLPNFLLFLFGVFLLYKINRDAKILDKENYESIFRKIKSYTGRLIYGNKNPRTEELKN